VVWGVTWGEADPYRWMRVVLEFAGDADRFVTAFGQDNGRPAAMTITIGTLSFDNVEYDADADVLYLSVGEPRMPAESFGTPEGHNIRYDETGAVIAITIVNAKWLLDRDGEIKLTIPSRVPAADLALALAG
jgi:uncharacterized protein YuzE